MQKYLIKTRHLGMRFIRREDFHHLKGVDKDAAVKQFFPEGTLNDEEIHEFITHCLSTRHSKNLPCFVIFRLKNDAFVGEAYFDELESGEIKVGYLYHKKYWNRGYATEILKALLKWARKNIVADYIIAYADKDNKASFRVMEKCGMQHYKDDHYLEMDCKFYRIKNCPKG